MARKRSPPKPQAAVVKNGVTNGASTRAKSTGEGITGDLPTYARVFLLAALVVGVSGFLLYPDILSVVKTIQEKALGAFYESDLDQRVPDTSDTSENRRPIQQSTKRDIHSKNDGINSQPAVDSENIDDDDESVSVEDDDVGDLMEEEETERERERLRDAQRESDDKTLPSKSKATDSKKEQKVQTNAGSGERSRAENDGHKDSNVPKEKSTTKTAHEEDATVKRSPKNKAGGKKGPIVLTPENNELVLDPSDIKFVNSPSDAPVKPKQPKKSADSSQGNTEKNQGKTSGQSSSKSELSSADSDDVLEEAKNFKPTFHKTFTPKKIFADGRRIPPVELLHQKESNSSVRIFLFDDFLSEKECDGLRKAHDNHVKAMGKPPILCFDSVGTLRKHIKDANKKIKVTPNDFTKGTKCVNASFSLQLQTWLKSNWSYSTAFYPGESPFSKAAANRIQQAMGLDPSSGGKFQITSYPEGKAYKEHTDCIVGGIDKRDRVATVLMYLSDVEEGGETTFPDLGIWVRPKKGRALVWNNMNPEGECEPHSKHVASVVKKGSKYILIRWYYYKTFYSLGRRPPPPHLPEREPGQPMVNCDEYSSGSCRWYDEWSYEPLLEYEKKRLTLV